MGSLSEHTGANSEGIKDTYGGVFLLPHGSSVLEHFKAL